MKPYLEMTGMLFYSQFTCRMDLVHLQTCEVNLVNYCLTICFLKQCCRAFLKCRLRVQV